MIDSVCNYFVIDNVMTGYSIHWLDDAACVWMYNTKPVKTFPKQVIFGEAGQRIIGGGEDGKAYVFHKVSGALLQVLQHSAMGCTQTIVVSSSHVHGSFLMKPKAFKRNTYYWITTATSSSKKNPKISIWKKPIPSVKQPSNPCTLLTVITTATQILVHVLALSMIAVLIS